MLNQYEEDDGPIYYIYDEGMSTVLQTIEINKGKILDEHKYIILNPYNKEEISVIRTT